MNSFEATLENDPRVVWSDLTRIRKGAWIRVGAALLVAFLIMFLLVLKEKYTSTVSIAVEQSQAGGLTSALSELGGGATGSKRDVGVLESEKLARAVAEEVHLREMYDLEDDAAAVDMMQQCLKVKDDDLQGIVYVSVSLPAPAPLRPDRRHLRERAPGVAALAANLYAAQLKAWYRDDDNGTDAMLQRGADDEVKLAKKEFADTTRKLHDFVNYLRTVDPRVVPMPQASAGDTPSSGESGGTVSGSKLSELPDLYGALADVEVSIAGHAALTSASQRVLSSELAKLNSVPFEDPLLRTARDAVVQAQLDLKNLQIQYGDQAPEVVAAKQRLEIARSRLSQEIEGLKAGRTTENATTSGESADLLARRAHILQKISEASGREPLKRELQFQLTMLQNEVVVALEVLKAAASATAQLHVQTVASGNRVEVIDTPDKPDKPDQPRILARIGLSLFGVLFLLGTWMVLDFQLATRRSAVPRNEASPEDGHRSDGNPLFGTVPR